MMKPSPNAALEEARRLFGAIRTTELDESYGRTLKTLEYVEKRLGGYAGKRVLDVGCSLGLHAIAAAGLGAAKVVGTDKYALSDVPSAFTLDAAERAVVQAAWKARAFEAVEHDVSEPFPFPDASFDLVISNAMFEHLHFTHKAFLEEARRVLRPGGAILLTTPNMAYLLQRLRFLIGRSPGWDLKDFYGSGPAFSGHTREFTVPEMRRMLEWSGFHDIDATALPTQFRTRWFRRPGKYHHILLQAVSRLSGRLGDLIFAHGRKP